MLQKAKLGDGMALEATRRRQGRSTKRRRRLLLRRMKRRPTRVGVPVAVAEMPRYAKLAMHRTWQQQQPLAEQLPQEGPPPSPSQQRGALIGNHSTNAARMSLQDRLDSQPTHLLVG